MENQLQTKITSLEKEVQNLKTELKTETIAHNLMLDKERKQVQSLQTEIANYESQKQTSDRIIQQLKNEVQQLRVEKMPTRQVIQAQEQRMQELTQQLATMTSLMEQELVSQVEFAPRG